MKTCSACGEDKALDEFYVDRSARDGRYSRCKGCHRASVKRYVETIGPRERRVQRLMAQYLISRDRAEALVDATICQICGVEASDLEVDHCHETGKVRGVLCGRCNKGIAIFDRDPVWLINATAYVWPAS